MLFALPDVLVNWRKSGLNARYSSIDRPIVDMLVVCSLIAALALPSVSLAADTGPGLDPDPASELPPELRAALEASIGTAGANGSPWSAPSALSAFLQAHPGRAMDIAGLAATQLAGASSAASGESKCGCAAGLATVLGSAQPQQASAIRSTLSTGAPECDLTVTQAMEETLAATSPEAGPKQRAMKPFAMPQPGGGGGGGGGCKGNCVSVEPGNEGVASQTAF